MNKHSRRLVGVAMVLGAAIGYITASVEHRNPSPAAPPAIESFLAQAVAKAPAKAAGKPNIVYIMTDNLGYGEVGCYGGGILRGAPTPRIDRLASEGFRLLNFNVEAQCTPTRSALL